LPIAILLKRRDPVPQLTLPYCLHKVQKEEEKTFRMQNVQVMLMSGISQAGIEACCCAYKGFYMRTKQPWLPS